MRAPILYALLPFLFAISVTGTSYSNSDLVVLCFCVLYLIALFGGILGKGKEDKGNVIGITLGGTLCGCLIIYNFMEKGLDDTFIMYNVYPEREVDVTLVVTGIWNKEGVDKKRITIFEGKIIGAPKVRKDLLDLVVYILTYKENNLSIMVNDRIKVTGVLKSNKLENVFDDCSYSISKVQRIKIIKKSLVGNIRRKIENQILENENLSKNCKGFIYAFIFGNKKLMTKKQDEKFRSMGIMHLFAVSGLHIGIGFLIIQYFLKRIIDSHIIIFCLSISILLLYVILVGSPVSAIRAFVMIVIWRFSVVVFRKSNSLSALGWAAIVILVFDYKQLDEIGFQLSFTVVLSILWILGKRVEKPKLSVLNSLCISFIVSCTAFFSSSLLVIDKFHYINPVSILLNTLLMPFVLFLFLIFLIYLISDFIYTLDWISSLITYVYTGVELFVSLFNSFDYSQIYFDTKFDIPDVFHLIFVCILIATRGFFQRLWQKLMFLSCLPVCFIFLSFFFN